MRTRAERRYNQYVKQQRRLKEDQQQHGGRAAMNDPCHWGRCPCFEDKRAQARFKDTPNQCSGYCCANPRRGNGMEKSLTLQERRAFQKEE